MKFNAILILATLSICIKVGFGEPGLSDCEFEKAINNRSTAPSYVMITVINGNTGYKSKVCISANHFLGAIHSENDFPYTREGLVAARKFAINEKSRTFTFKKKKALDNIRTRYDESQIESARKNLDSIPLEKLQQAIYSGTACSRLMRDACAFVLLEKGIPAAIADISGQLRVNWNGYDSTKCKNGFQE